MIVRDWLEREKRKAMLNKTHIWVEEPFGRSGMTTIGMTVEGPRLRRKRIWYQLPSEYSTSLTKSSDPFLLAMIFSAMRLHTDLHVHGEVSPSLLRNIEEFQSAWVCWRPKQYVMVDITADVEREQPTPHNDKKAVTLFSGGVDSSFTVFRHKTGRSGRRNLELHAGLMVHGFDIALTERDDFVRAAQKAKRMLDSIGIPLISMTTNIRELGDPWWDFHGAAPASCLALLQGGFSVGIIPSTEPYNALVLPWGSNPVTDWMLSSRSFAIVHDGASFARTEKVREIAGWSEALQYLRVCMVGKPGEHDANCGVCEKCIRTILNFRVLGIDLPGCFEKDVTDEQIAGLRGLDQLKLAELDRILAVAKAEGVSGAWVKALETCIRRNRMRRRIEMLMRRVGRKFFALGGKGRDAFRKEYMARNMN